MMRQTLIHCLTGVLLLLLAAPAFAGPIWGTHSQLGWQATRPPLGLSHSVESRFGVVSWRNSQTGERGVEPLVGLRYRINWGHETDNGWRIDLTFEVEGATHGLHRHRSSLTGR